MFTTVKNKLTGEKIIILALVAFLAISFTYLAYVEENRLSATSGVGWEAYFTDPKSDDLTFGIKNGEKKSRFSWKELSVTGSILRNGEIEVSAGEEKTINLENKNSTEKITIEITGVGGEKRELYKR